MIIRRYQDSDRDAIRQIYTIATAKVISEGLSQALIENTPIWLMSILFAYCLLNNYWYISIPGAVLYLALPSLVSLGIGLGKLKSDVNDPGTYFSRPRSALFVAELIDSEHPDGYLIGMVGIKEANVNVNGKFKGLRKDGDAELVRMNMLPNYQGRGVSHMLMNAAIMFATEQGYKRIILTSSSLQHVATKILYPKYGFVFEKETNVILGIKPCFMSKVLTITDSKLK